MHSGGAGAAVRHEAHSAPALPRSWGTALRGTTSRLAVEADSAPPAPKGAPRSPRKGGLSSAPGREQPPPPPRAVPPQGRWQKSGTARAEDARVWQPRLTAVELVAVVGAVSPAVTAQLLLDTPPCVTHEPARARCRETGQASSPRPPAPPPAQRSKAAAGGLQAR